MRLLFSQLPTPISHLLSSAFMAARSPTSSARERRCTCICRGRIAGVFNLAGWRGSETVILCEALIDALTFWCAGLCNVTSAFGVGGCTDELLQAFVENGVKRVLIAYDADEAGDRAAEALVPKLAAHGIEAYRVVFPRGMDANAFALAGDAGGGELGAGCRAGAVNGSCEDGSREMGVGR